MAIYIEWLRDSQKKKKKEEKKEEEEVEEEEKRLIKKKAYSIQFILFNGNLTININI